MPTTPYVRSIATASWFQPPDFANPVAAFEWQVMASSIVARPTSDANWHVTSALTATVDPGTVGQLRLRTSEGDVSAEARINSHVGPVLMGFTRVTWSADDDVQVFLEGRRIVGDGGGVRVHRAALSLESAPSSGTAVIYPTDYDPNVGGNYPPSYNQDPYT